MSEPADARRRYPVWSEALLVTGLLLLTVLSLIWLSLRLPGYSGGRSSFTVAEPNQGAAQSPTPAPSDLAPAAPGLAAAREALPATSSQPSTVAPVPKLGSDSFSSTSAFRLASRPQSQLPELRNGCEVTTLSMLLDAVGAPANKMTLAREQPTDATQPVFNQPDRGFNSIREWGNPNRAFVGSVAGSYGYAIYHGPLRGLLDRKTAGRALDLTGRRFSDVLTQLRTGVPVLLWTTTTMRPPTSWVRWQTPDGPCRATQEEHAVLLVGYSPSGLIVDDPLTGRARLVSAGPFIAAWQALGRQALSVRPGTK